MVSDGTEFKLWIPVKNKFYVGHNDVVKPAANTLENLRPQVIYEALLLHAIDPENDIAVLEADNPVEFDDKTKQVTRVVHLCRRCHPQRHRRQILPAAKSHLRPAQDLIPDHQIFYDKQGSVVTDATYSGVSSISTMCGFPPSSGSSGPRKSTTSRIAIIKAHANGTLKDEQFALDQPPGSQLVDLDQPR